MCCLLYHASHYTGSSSTFDVRFTPIKPYEELQCNTVTIISLNVLMYQHGILYALQFVLFCSHVGQFIGFCFKTQNALFEHIEFILKRELNKKEREDVASEKRK